MEACKKKQKVQDTKVVRRLLGKNLRFVQSTTCSVGKACVRIPRNKKK